MSEVTERERAIIKDMCAASHSQLNDMRTAIRTFGTGATRSNDNGKPEYAGYLSPRVIRAFGLYMLKNQVQADGTVRDSRNWQKGIPLESYMQSMWRHFHAVWSAYETSRLDGFTDEQAAEIIVDLMALLFNVQGMAHEILGDNYES